MPNLFIQDGMFVELNGSTEIQQRLWTNHFFMEES